MNYTVSECVYVREKTPLNDPFMGSFFYAYCMYNLTVIREPPPRGELSFRSGPFCSVHFRLPRENSFSARHEFCMQNSLRALEKHSATIFND